MGNEIGKPIPNISEKDAIIEHDKSCDCSEPYIIKKPHANIEHYNMFSKKFYTTYSWQCLKCKWESEIIKTRVV